VCYSCFKTNHRPNAREPMSPKPDQSLIDTKPLAPQDVAATALAMARAATPADKEVTQVIGPARERKVPVEQLNEQG
jgi:hypothetical protein